MLDDSLLTSRTAFRCTNHKSHELRCLSKMGPLRRSLVWVFGARLDSRRPAVLTGTGPSSRPKGNPCQFQSQLTYKLPPSVQLWSQKVLDWAVPQIEGHEELYRWDRDYDPDLLGYMVSVLPMIYANRDSFYII